MLPGKGQSNKHGVSAVVIRGLSMVWEPLSCFLIVSRRPSSLAFYSWYDVHCGERRKPGWKVKGTEKRNRGKKVCLYIVEIRFIEKGCGYRLFSPGTVFFFFPSSSKSLTAFWFLNAPRKITGSHCNIVSNKCKSLRRKGCRCRGENKDSQKKAPYSHSWFPPFLCVQTCLRSIYQSMKLLVLSNDRHQVNCRTPFFRFSCSQTLTRGGTNKPFRVTTNLLVLAQLDGTAKVFCHQVELSN